MAQILFSLAPLLPLSGEAFIYFERHPSGTCTTRWRSRNKVIARSAMLAPPGINNKAIIYRTNKWRKSFAARKYQKK